MFFPYMLCTHNLALLEPLGGPANTFFTSWDEYSLRIWCLGGGGRLGSRAPGPLPRGSRSAKLWVHTIYGKNNDFSTPPNGPKQPFIGPFGPIRPWEKTPGTCRTRSAPRSRILDPYEPVSEPFFIFCRPDTCAERIFLRSRSPRGLPGAQPGTYFKS